MKKAIFSLVCLVAAICASAALPGGSYVNSRGKVKAVVDVSGTELYIVNSEGKVTVTYQISDEQPQSDGTTRFRIVSNNYGTVTALYNNYYRVNPSTGEFELDLECQPSILYHE